jgi:serine/threonine-protein kinase
MDTRPLHLNRTIPAPGEMIAGKYVVEGECGRGGLAVVLSARHAELDRQVAIKVLLPEWVDNRGIVERFLREGRAATRIRSEHVVRVFDVGAFDTGVPFLVLEYLEGQNLDEVLASWGPLPVPTAIDWLLQAAEAIAEAHAQGIVHRDLKPANLFLTKRPDGTCCIKVIDFGLSKLVDSGVWGPSAKLTGPTDVMGSPHYMAPEQLRAQCEADARTDLWALGAVLYELVTAQPPFRGSSVPELCALVLTQPPPPISLLRDNVPEGVERAILRCLEKDPDARYAGVADLAQALAPYGSPLARASCQRIEGVLAFSAPRSERPPLPPAEPSWDANDAWPSRQALVPFPKAQRTSDPLPGYAYVSSRRLGDPVSGRIVLGSLLFLAGLGCAVFMAVHATVHSHDSERLGAANMQPEFKPVTEPARRAEPAWQAMATAEPAAPPPKIVLPAVVPTAVPARPDGGETLAAQPADARDRNDVRRVRAGRKPPVVQHANPYPVTPAHRSTAAPRVQAPTPAMPPPEMSTGPTLTEPDPDSVFAPSDTPPPAATAPSGGDGPFDTRK